MGQRIFVPLEPHTKGCKCGWVRPDDTPCGKSCDNIAAWEITGIIKGEFKSGSTVTVSLTINLCEECLEYGACGHNFSRQDSIGYTSYS
jgi:hypothetical protein